MDGSPKSSRCTDDSMNPDLDSEFILDGEDLTILDTDAVKSPTVSEPQNKIHIRNSLLIFFNICLFS